MLMGFFFIMLELYRAIWNHHPYESYLNNAYAIRDSSSMCQKHFHSRTAHSLISCGLDHESNKV